MSDMPSEEAVPADQAGLIMHAALTFDDHLLMGSDDPTGDGGPMRGISVNYTVADTADAARVFEALADGGEVTMPLAETFWSPLFRHVRRPVRRAVDGQRRGSGFPSELVQAWSYSRRSAGSLE